MCLIHDQYGPELREALRMKEPIVLRGADQELRARRLFHLIQQAFTGYPKIEHMIRNQIMARGAADVISCYALSETGWLTRLGVPVML